MNFALARHKMVAEQLERRGISDARVLEAMEWVPRHEFVPPDLIEQAYEDRALPIGLEQTISQPYTVVHVPGSPNRGQRQGVGNRYRLGLRRRCVVDAGAASVFYRAH